MVADLRIFSCSELGCVAGKISASSKSNTTKLLESIRADIFSQARQKDDVLLATRPKYRRCVRSHEMWVGICRKNGASLLRARRAEGETLFAARTLFGTERRCVGMRIASSEDRRN